MLLSIRGQQSPPSHVVVADARSPSGQSDRSGEKLRAEIVTQFSALASLKADWRRLWEQNPSREVFGLFGWAEAWWRAYGEGRQLYTPVVFRGSQVVGILPLYRHGRVLAPVGVPGADYFDILCEPENSGDILACALQCLCDEGSGWDYCQLDNVSEKSLLFKAVNDVSGQIAARLRLVFTGTCRSLLLDKDREEVLGRSLQGSKKKKHQNKLLRQPTTTFRDLELASEARQHLPGFFEQHIARQACAGNRSQFLAESTRKFYSLLLDNDELKPLIRFSVLESRSHPVAYHFGFESEGKFLLYKPSFDIDYWDDSPGEALNLALLSTIAGNRAVHTFDLTYGDEGYKAQISNSTTKNYSLLFFGSGPKAFLVKTSIAAKKTIRTHPSIFEKGKQMLAYARKLSSLRQHVGRLRSATSLTAAGDIQGASQSQFWQLDLRRAAEQGRSCAYVVPRFSLSQLALIAAKTSVLDIAMLREARARIKRRHAAYGVLSDGTLMCVIWISSSSQAVVDAGGEAQPGETLRHLMYDVWWQPELSSSELATAIGTTALSVHPSGEVILAPPTQDRRLAEAFRKAGFEPHSL